jgi:high-affinity iron transporter
MLAAALIVFREVLEAALVITVVMAATRGLLHRGRWVGIGIMGGIAGAALVAALTRFIASSFAGAGEEIVNAAILFIAVALIGWHVVWMNSHGRQIALEMRAAAKRVAEGERHMSILAIVVGLAVMREGSEIVLMLQGLWAGSPSPVPTLGGGLIGLALGAAMGTAIYFGLLALSISRLFALTNGLLVLIAAGMAAKGANFLTQADLLPTLGTRLWDTSFILSDSSVTGKALGALIGYIARPSGVEVLFYAGTVGIVLLLIRLANLHTHAGDAAKIGA